MEKEKSKYASQAAYNRRTYVRFPLDLKPDILQAFREACEKTTQLRQLKSRNLFNPISTAIIKQKAPAISVGAFSMGKKKEWFPVGSSTIPS